MMLLTAMLMFRVLQVAFMFSMSLCGTAAVLGSSLWLLKLLWS